MNEFLWRRTGASRDEQPHDATHPRPVWGPPARVVGRPARRATRPISREAFMNDPG